MCSSEFEYNTKLSFLTEWYDYEAGYLKHFQMTYFPYDNTLELFDTDFNRLFLRRSASENLEMKDLFLGNKIRLYGRQIEIKQYADDFTKKIIGKAKEHTFAIVKPNVVDKLGDIVNEIQSMGFQICRMRMCLMTRRDALDFYESRKGDVFLPFIIEHMISGPLVGLEIVGNDAIKRWHDALGPEDPEEARKVNPDCLRARYGKTTAVNAFHGSADMEQAVKEACYFFPQGVEREPPKSTAKLENSTCCVIKPHAIQENKLGNILTSITENELYAVSALKMIYLSNPDADEFLEIYKGVVSDFHAMLLSFLDGPCVALEISAKKEGIDVHKEFRKFVGPMDSDVARQIRPNTLRGMYGVDKHRNAVHCTDLPEDTQMELEYFFKILD